MKERPILFSAPMVRALLEGSKTQTRRAIKLPHMNPLGKWEASTFGGPNGGRTRDGKTVPLQGCIWHTRTGDSIGSPHGAPGDRLWVRETWAQNENQLSDDRIDTSFVYRADGGPRALDNGGDKPWRPSIFMPRRACRLTLEITDVRAERLQDISAADARAEGHPIEPGRSHDSAVHDDAARDWYADLWDSINGPGKWAANPWVWVLSFKRTEHPCRPASDSQEQSATE